MPSRRGARVVEWDGLENRCGCKLTVGSNPTLSANISSRINEMGLTGPESPTLSHRFAFGA